ncbi:SGNH/GDSL hydrolase family protein [Aquihabitans daechungensis]|uniref:SGNH/GDSL hydrolase family protein n=1 Tax=Aquihabitans daechungensis TaxID=1052257 RepID=UPI003BA02325
MRSASRSVVRSAVVVLALASCSSASSDPGPATTATSSTTTVATTTSAPVDEGPQTVVRVVADSEVPDAVSELLDQQPGIEVASMRSVEGATMAELDESVDEALAQEPDVLVYSGGTNDLETGPLQMLEGLEERLARYAARTCVVMAVPIFRYERGTDAEVAERTKGTRVLEQAAASAGARVASYLDVSLAMDDRGEDFFAEGELGDLHPGTQAYPGIAESIAEQVRACS